MDQDSGTERRRGTVRPASRPDTGVLPLALLASEAVDEVSDDATFREAFGALHASGGGRVRLDGIECHAFFWDSETTTPGQAEGAAVPVAYLNVAFPLDPGLAPTAGFGWRDPSLGTDRHHDLVACDAHALMSAVVEQALASARDAEAAMAPVPGP